MQYWLKGFYDHYSRESIHCMEANSVWHRIKRIKYKKWKCIGYTIRKLPDSIRRMALECNFLVSRRHDLPRNDLQGKSWRQQQWANLQKSYALKWGYGFCNEILIAVKIAFKTLICTDRSVSIDEICQKKYVKFLRFFLPSDTIKINSV